MVLRMTSPMPQSGSRKCGTLGACFSEPSSKELNFTPPATCRAKPLLPTLSRSTRIHRQNDHPQMPIRIFISHAAADQALASALVDCILGSMVLDDEELRCTSVPGHKLPVGSDFAATLLADLGESSVVIGLITSNAASSSWVLFELGATWGANKNLKPLVTDEVDLKSLPGPLAGRHVARFSSKGDVNQFLDEISTAIGSKRRTVTKTQSAIDKLEAAHAEHVKRATSSESPASKPRVQTKSSEPTFSGILFSELLAMLNNEKVTLPARLVDGFVDRELTVLEIFLANFDSFVDGVQSNCERDTAGGFMYYEVGLRLVPFGLVNFAKLPAAQARFFKRLTVTAEGNKFILQYRKLLSEKKK